MASLSYSPFASFGKLNLSVLDDDYVYGNFETWKFKGKTTKGGKLDLKAKVKHTEKDKTFSASIEEELKLEFPYKRFTFWIGSRRNGDLKFHVDLGEVDLKNKKVNLFTNLKTNTEFKKWAFRFGANYFGPQWESNTRLENSQCGNSGLLLTQRTLVR